MRITAVAAATAATLAVGAAGASAEKIVKKKSFPTTVTAAFASSGPVEEYANPSGTFSGTVGSSKNKCVKTRGVEVRHPNGSSIGQTTTSNGGAWSLAGNNLPLGQYTVDVAKSKIIKEKEKPNGTQVKKKIVCEAASTTLAVG